MSPVLAGSSGLALGVNAQTVYRGSSAAALRLGHLGVLDSPDGLAILDLVIGGGTLVLTHSAANKNGSNVSYAYFWQVGFSLPVVANPTSASETNGVVTATFTDPGYAGEFTVIVEATNDSGTTPALITTPGESRFPQTWPAGSLPKNAQDEFDGDPVATLAYSGTTRNGSAWFNAIDLRSVATTAKGGALISPEHALFAAHYAPSVGATVTFIDQSLTAPISRTVLAVAVHPGYEEATYRNDIAVARLSAPVPLPAAKTLPARWRDYIPYVNSYLRLPLIAFEASGSGQVVSSPLLEDVTENGFMLNYVDRDPTQLPTIVSGDSGQPLFLLVNGEAVLIGTFTGSFYGTFLPDEFDEVNGLMQTLGGGYELQAVDLSEFADLVPGQPTIESDPESLVPENGSLFLTIYAPTYAGTSPISDYEIYADGSLLPNARFGLSALQYYSGGAIIGVNITGSQGDFAGTALTARAVNAVGSSAPVRNRNDSLLGTVMAMSPRLLRPVNNVFTPASLPGLALWLDAAAADALYQNSDGTVPATAPGDPVGYWRDRSGTGLTAVTADATKRPLVATVNGRRALDFDGVNDTLTMQGYSAENGLTGLTRFAVAFADSSASSILLTVTDNGISYKGGARFIDLQSSTIQFTAGSSGFTVGSVNVANTGYTLARDAPHVLGSTYDGSKATLEEAILAHYDGATLTPTSTSGAVYSPLVSGGTRLHMGSNVNANNWWNGKICEYLVYDRVLNPAQRRKVEVYLARRWGITLAPQVSNAEAQDWISRVYANGGTVSTSTASAVSTFCDAIEAAGIRDRFARLNLFCGSSLNAALVPLYKSLSFGGASLGNATDTNNAFVGVGTDYAETGASGGLTGNGTSKYLNTGLTVSNIGTPASGHMSVYHGQSSGVNSNRYYMGANDAATSNRFYLGTDAFSTASVFGSYGSAVNASQTLAAQGHGAAGHRILSRETDSVLTHYHNGSVVATNTTTITPAVSTAAFAVFAANRNATVDRFHNSWIAAYSIGLGLNSTQAANYRTIMQTFQTALGRNV